METNYKSLWSIILCAPELKGRMMFTVDALPMLCCARYCCILSVQLGYLSIYRIYVLSKPIDVDAEA